MLVLTRKSEEQIVIGNKNQIVITILKIQGDKVSVGIKAPDKIPIYRKELLLKESNFKGGAKEEGDEELSIDLEEEGEFEVALELNKG